MLNSAHDISAHDRIISEYASDPDMIDLISDFLVSLQTTAATVARLSADGDHAELQRVAHQIKGSAGGYGFPAITAVAGRLETVLKAGQPVTPQHPLLVELLQAIGRTQPVPNSSAA